MTPQHPFSPSKCTPEAEASAALEAWASQRGRPRWVSTWLMLLTSAILLTLIFPPFYCFFLAPFALVPFCICVLRRPLWWRFAGAYYLLGVCFFVSNLFWLWPVTAGGYIALSMFVALYFVVFAVAFHRLVVQFRLPATLALPLAWTAVEYVRASFVEGGFPWFLLGNALAPAAVLIQSADLVGVWGITFIIAMLNGLLVDVLRLPLRQGRNFHPVIVRLAVTVGIVLVLHLAYGVFRLSQNTTRDGPRIAVIQENFEQRIKDDPGNARIILLRHLALARAAASAQPRPDIVAWPETMVTTWVNPEFLQAPYSAFAGFGSDEFTIDLNKRNGRECLDVLQEICDQYSVAQLIGYGAIEPRGDYSKSIKQNRTGLMIPGGKGAIIDEYAKVHLVPFGEYIPFRTLPLIGKYMVYLTPYQVDYSNKPGNRWTRFALRIPASTTQPEASPPTTPQSREYTFGTPICFEDTMPYPSRLMTAPRPGAAPDSPDSRKADFLVNVSNDGWFHWVELDQHLQASQLRAVENRIAIARSVNTGNSGFIDTNGRIMGLVTSPDGSSIKAVGVLAMNVPIDSRTTLYSRIGDLFPIVCGILTTVLVGWTVVRPRRSAAA